MDEHRAETARTACRAAYDGSMDFPAIVGMLVAAGFEGYAVDYRRAVAAYYLPDGDSVDVALPDDATPIAAGFDATSVEAAIRQAQLGAAGYTYAGFCRTVKAAGCAGYLVSFTGRRVVYYGRTAETHVEHFPS